MTALCIKSLGSDVTNLLRRSRSFAAQPSLTQLTTLICKAVTRSGQLVASTFDDGKTLGLPARYHLSLTRPSVARLRRCSSESGLPNAPEISDFPPNNPPSIFPSSSKLVDNQRLSTISLHTCHCTTDCLIVSKPFSNDRPHCSRVH